MNVRFGLILAGSVMVAVGGCAPAGTSGGAPAPATGVLGGEVLEQGESPREDEFTEAADEALESAAEAGTPEAASPFYEQALQAAQQGIAADSTNPLPYLQTARANLGLERYVDAGAAFDRAEELRPIYTLETEGLREQAWIDLYQQASPLVNSGDYEQAVEFFEQANAIYQGRPEVMTTLGAIYFQLARYDEAIEQFRMAQEIIESDRILEMDSTTAESWREQGAELPVQIAQALIQAGRHDEASQALRALIAENPDNKLYLQNLAQLFVQMEQPDSAATIYDQLLSRPDLDHREAYNVGIGFYQLENFLRAADAFELAAEKAPMHRDALEMWARSLQIATTDAEEAGETPDPAALDEIETAGRRWTELDPYNQTGFLILAQAASKRNDEARAGELVEQIETMEVSVDNLNAQTSPDGGATVVGQMKNLLADQGTTVTLNFRFYDAAGTEIGTQSVQVSAPATDASTEFRVDFVSEQEVAGYRYDLTL